MLYCWRNFFMIDFFFAVPRLARAFFALLFRELFFAAAALTRADKNLFFPEWLESWKRRNEFVFRLDWDQFHYRALSISSGTRVGAHLTLFHSPHAGAQPTVD